MFDLTTYPKKWEIPQLKTVFSTLDTLWGGKQPNGTPMRAKSFICKVCGKEGRPFNIRAHIEANHLEGIFIPCDICEKTCSSRESLRFHKRRFHK